ncbi:mannan endo-1,4-beta-mannosidase [Synchytrium endobioticum]|uniref:Mannan endo-1,4-beta-mannosidase n=1 Tax=Synchytrium endobioticum TaxID=286115 RepID=A0A507CSZ1_9FUNG|nr:mannan endo-1,4-beta-mannosidase [Synchytrium endobioticum]TPX42180.1 mannan endo-1,4-beta-mannosidase [Synchytrium endobioticum]
MVITAAPGVEASSLALLEPRNGVYVMVWPDTEVAAHQADSPSKINERLARNIPIWHFAQNIPTLSMSGTPNISVNIGIETKMNTTLVESTNSDAMIFLTIYPFLAGDMDAVTDDDIRALAAQCKQLNAAGRKVFLRLAPEMNGGWYPWGQKPSTYITFWRRVATAVRVQAPATAFVWSPNVRGTGGFALANWVTPQDFQLMDTNNDGIVNGTDDPYGPFYPGDAYVDWVGLSLYYYGIRYPYHTNVVPPSSWFVQTMGGFGTFDFYKIYVEGHNKPFACSECSSTFFATQPAGSLLLSVPPGPGELAIKQSWWNQTVTSRSLLQQFPRIKLWGLFEFRKKEDDTYRDFQVLNQSNPNNVFPAFLADLRAAESNIPFIWAKSTVIPSPLSSAPSPIPSDDGASSHVVTVLGTSDASGQVFSNSLSVFVKSLAAGSLIACWFG